MKYILPILLITLTSSTYKTTSGDTKSLVCEINISKGENLIKYGDNMYSRKYEDSWKEWQTCRKFVRDCIQLQKQLQENVAVDTIDIIGVLDIVLNAGHNQFFYPFGSFRIAKEFKSKICDEGYNEDIQVELSRFISIAFENVNSAFLSFQIQLKGVFPKVRQLEFNPNADSISFELIAQCDLPYPHKISLNGDEINLDNYFDLPKIRVPNDTSLVNEVSFSIITASGTKQKVTMPFKVSIK